MVRFVLIERACVEEGFHNLTLMVSPMMVVLLIERICELEERFHNFLPSYMVDPPYPTCAVVLLGIIERACVEEGFHNLTLMVLSMMVVLLVEILLQPELMMIRFHHRGNPYALSMRKSPKNIL